MKKHYPPFAIVPALVLTLAQNSYAAKDYRLEEVVVTARKVTENMQDVPVAVSSFSQETIEALNLHSARDVLAFTPGATANVLIADGSGLSLRGIASGNRGASEDAGLLIMKDNEVVSRGFMQNIPTFDIERVEVLRGPQGTTYGRNATAGVMHFMSYRPSEDFKGGLKIDTGNYNLRATEGFVNGSLGDDVSARLSGMFSKHDGYFEDALTGESIDDEEVTALRGQVLFEPNEDLSLLFRTHWLDFHADAFAPRKNNQLEIPFSAGPGGWPFVTYTEVSSDPWTIVTNDNELDGYDIQVWGASLEIQKSFGDLSLFSMTAYTTGEDEAQLDLLGTPISFFVESVSNNAETWTQEIRLDNTNSNNRLDWMVGAFYLLEKHDRAATSVLLGGLCAQLPAGCLNPPNFLPFFYGGIPFDSLDQAETVQAFTQLNDTDSFGIFGEISYDISDDTNLILGLRYSDDKKDYDGINTASGALSFFFLEGDSVRSDTSNSWDALSGKIALSHHLTDNIMTFGSVSNGYKSGGFNAEPASAEAVTSFDEETVTTTELGIKMDAFDERLRLNISVFDSNYEDIQATFINASAVAVARNVGSAFIRGMEIEGVALLSENLRLQFAAADLDHEYEEFVTEAGGTGADVVGNPIQEAPDWTATLAVMYDIPLSSGAMVGLRADYRGRGETSTTPENDPLAVREGSRVFNAQMSYTSPDGSLNVALWGRNLNNEAEVGTITPQLQIFTQRALSYGPPRTVGITLNYMFN